MLKNERCKKKTEHEKFLEGKYPRTGSLLGGEWRMDGKTDDLATLNGDSERSRSMRLSCQIETKPRKFWR